MNHPVHKRHHGYGAEWLQALFTLAVLTSFYTMSLSFENKDTWTSWNTQSWASSYWNPSLKYGFHGNDGDTYKKIRTNASDEVNVTSKKGAWEKKDGPVVVSFYSDNISFENIDKMHDNGNPRAYSRLSNGIAVIEGDLASARAKNILATLHAQ